METRELTRRNFLGGFVGGTLGVLAAVSFHTALAVPAVIVGVIVGFWYDAIARVITGACRNEWRRVCRYANAAYRVPIATIGAFVPRVVRGLVAFERSELLTTITALRAWRRGRTDVNRMDAAHRWAIAIFFTIHTAFLLPLLYIFDVYYSANLTFSAMLALMIATLLTFCCGLFAFQAGNQNRHMLLRRRLRQFRKHGTFAFAIHGLYALLCAEFGGTIVGVTCLSASTVVSVPLMLLVMLPLSVCILTLRGIARISARPQHWLCVGVTLAVTIASASIVTPYLHDIRALWFAALATGALSGAATEVVRRAINRALAPTTRLRTFIEGSITEHFARINDAGDAASHAIATRSVHLLPTA
ncbi:MAG: hypothetical protein Q7S96_03495 [bacterium]|nr:hypothetical protein [bacterium]